MTPEAESATLPAVTATAGVDETALILAAKNGDQRAFERLVRGYDRAVLRLAYNWLRSSDDAQEAYQETFLRAYKNLRWFRQECNFETWLYRIAVNVCLDRLRKRRAQAQHMAGETAGAVETRLEQLPESRPQADPERALMNRELRLRIEQALEDLTPRERTVFELRHYHGLRLRVIGEILGASEEAAKMCLFRATQKMRSALQGWL